MTRLWLTFGPETSGCVETMQPYSELANWDGSLSAPDSRSTTEPPPSSASHPVNNLFRDMVDPLPTDPNTLPLSPHDPHDPHTPALYDLYSKPSQNRHQHHHHQVLHLSPLSSISLTPAADPKKRAYMHRFIAHSHPIIHHFQQQQQRHRLLTFTPCPCPGPRPRCRARLGSHRRQSMRRCSSRMDTDITDRRKTRSCRRKNARSWPISRSILMTTPPRGCGPRAQKTKPTTAPTTRRRCSRIVI